jgi:2-polyprenyl-6-methoxyphenol hydroxylase-like FAD-dependent oxidoreductase
VVLIGDESPHRRALPESLSPGIHPLLDLLDLNEALDTFAVKCDPPDVRWEKASPPTHPASGPSGYLVDRSKLDACLLDAARRTGIQVIAMRVGEVPARRTHGGWLVRIATPVFKEVHADFLVVATGRKPLLFQGRKRIMPPLLALHSRWKLPHAARPRISIEALREGWVWWARLTDGSCYAIAFMDPALRRQSGQLSIEKIYTAFLSEAAVSRDCLGGSRMDRVRACDASALLANKVIGSDWILVGDSAVALEPISAQGIQVALKLGCQSAAVVHTLLSDASSAPVAETFYRGQCQAIAARHARVATEFYAGPKRFRHDPFWMARTSHHTNPALGSATAGLVDSTTLLRLSTDASFRRLPCLVGDRICLKTALDHPSLDGPVAYLGNVAVAALLRGTTEAQRAGDLYHSWMRRGLTERPLTLLHWFLRNGILTPANMPA